MALPLDGRNLISRYPSPLTTSTPTVPPPSVTTVSGLSPCAGIVRTSSPEAPATRKVEVNARFPADSGGPRIGVAFHVFDWKLSSTWPGRKVPLSRKR